jgi:hypothetical protein
LRTVTTELELERAGDRRLFAIAGVGTLRFEGLLSRHALAEADGSSWSFSRRGLLGGDAEAAGADGAVVGRFDANGLRRGGSLSWNGRELALRAASAWRERYALVEDGRELALFDGKGWGSRPVRITIDDLGAVDNGLLLFAAFVVRGLADDASAGAGAAASIAATG